MGALPPVTPSKDAMGSGVFDHNKLFRRERADYKVQKWSQKLEEALADGRNPAPRRSASVGSPVAQAQTGAAQPWFAGFHRVKGEFDRAIKADMGTRRSEDRSVAHPSVRGLFRTELLAKGGEAAEGIDLDGWRHRSLQVQPPQGSSGASRSSKISGSPASSKTCPTLEGATLRSESAWTSRASKTSGHSRASKPLFEDAAEPWNDNLSDLEDMTLDELVSTWDDWLKTHSHFIKART